MSGAAAGRPTVRVIIIHGEALLVIDRYKDGRHFVVLPGGGIEAGETPEQAGLRELMEETSVTARSAAVIAESSLRGSHITIVKADYASGTPSLHPDSVEAAISSPANSYRPMWLPLQQLSGAPLRPGGLKEFISHSHGLHWRLKRKKLQFVWLD